MKTFKDLRFNIEEKTLTPAEKKKREEVAKAIERENPNMPMGMKMAIATKTAKRVAEEEDQQIDELSKDTLSSYLQKRGSMVSPRSKNNKGNENMAKAVSKIAKKTNEEVELGEAVHRIGLTVTDPNHPMVSKRKETIQKTVRITSDDREKAINSAKAHYRRKGYKVHDHHYLGTVNEEVKQVAEETKYYSLVHKATNKVLSTHKDLDSAKDEHRGMDQGERAHYRIATSTKEPKTFNMKEDTELEELNQMTLARYQSKAKSVGMQGGPKSAKHLAGAKRAGEKLKYGDYSEEVKDEYARKVDKYLKKKYNKEEIKITEGFDDYKKIAAELVKRHGKNVNKQHIKDLEDERDTRRPLDHSEVMKHVKQMHNESVQVNEVSKKTAVSYIQKKVSQIAKRPGEAMLYTTKMNDKDYSNLKRAYKRAGVKEEVELDEANQFPSKEHAINYSKEKVKSFKDKDDGIEVYTMPKGGASVVHTSNSQGREHVIKQGGKKVSTVHAKEEVELDETKSAPKGFHFTKDGKLKRGDADQDGPGGPMLRSDPLDKTRSKVPPVSEEHYCAKHVYSNVYGEGVVLEGQHADPDENGNIEWYVVEFAEGPKKVYTEKLDIMVAEYHGNHKKKRMTNG